MLTNLLIGMGFSRDSWTWLWLQLITVAALISSNVFDVSYWCGYLGIPLSPTALHWVFALSALVLWISGRYNSSPLPSERAMKSGAVAGSPAAKIGAVLLACALTAGASAGCASTQKKHAAVVVDVALFQSLNDIHAAEQSALCGLPSCAGSSKVEFLPGWTAAKSQAFNRALLPAVTGGRGFNDVLRAWKPGASMPSQVATMITSVGQALANVTETFPDGASKSAILGNIAKAQTLILQALSFVLILGGS